MTQHAVARFDQLDARRPMRVQAGSEEVILVRQGNEIHAFQGNCPHAGAPLEEGLICAGVLVCPWHKAAFAIKDGSVCEPPALAGLRRYRAWVEDGEVWVDDQPLPRSEPPRRSDARTFVVVGAGAAGSAAVATLLDHGFGGRLIWLDQERHPAYDRTALSKFVISGELSPDEVPSLLEPEQLRRGQLDRRIGKVRSLDAKKQRITLADGHHIDYDAALLATGAIPLRPNLPGIDLQGIMTLRSREDAARLLDAAEPGKPVVVVGDGFIGLEAASALQKYGAKVHVVARHEVPLANQLGDRIGHSIRMLHERKGVTFHAPTEVERFLGDGSVEAVQLANGERLAASVVVLGTGVRPATGCVQGVQLSQDHSLQVDAELKVAHGLWAAGDLVTFPCAGRPVRIEHWRLAQQHGVIAAMNMLGEHRRYEDVPFFWTYHHGRTYEMLGHAQDWDRIEFVGAPETGEFLALQCTGERVQAVIANGYSDAMTMLSQRMKQPLSLDDALKLIG